MKKFIVKKPEKLVEFGIDLDFKEDEDDCLFADIYSKKVNGTI